MVMGVCVVWGRSGCAGHGFELDSLGIPPAGAGMCVAHAGEEECRESHASLSCVHYPCASVPMHASVPIGPSHFSLIFFSLPLT